MHFQIFLPEASSQPGPMALAAVGLADLVPGHECIPSDGPDGKHGLLVGWRRPGKNERLHFNADHQDWIPALPNGPDGQGKGRYFVGFWKDSPIVPDDLKRPFQHYGPLLELGDGQPWRIPVIEELPRDFTRADDGSWQLAVQAAYHDLWMEARDWNTRLDSGRITTSYVEILDFIERLLGQNYRLLPEVVSHLRLFNSTNIAQVFGAALSRDLSESENT